LVAPLRSLHQYIRLALTDQVVVPDIPIFIPNVLAFLLFFDFVCVSLQAQGSRVENLGEIKVMFLEGAISSPLKGINLDVNANTWRCLIVLLVASFSSL
jgi:hypothetical protein